MQAVIVKKALTSQLLCRGEVPRLSTHVPNYKENEELVKHYLKVLNKKSLF